ncbi:unnamed protein product, partial [Prorocentrum cordatum]
SCWDQTAVPSRSSDGVMAVPPMAMPPGAWYNAPGAAVYQQQQPAGRFAGHFMPHRLCHHFTNQGWCRKEEACTFAHGPTELHPRAAATAGLPQQMAVAPVVAKA